MKKIFFTIASVLALAVPGLVNTAYADTEISCIDDVPDTGRGDIEALVATEGGRLILSIYQVTDSSRRLLAREGVSRRPAPGREFDVLYIGRDAKLSVNSQTGDALLQAPAVQNNRPLPMVCDLNP